MVIEANMVELVKSPSTRVLSKGRLALWLVVSLVFAALLFAVDAQAQGTNAPEGAAETPIGEAATKSSAPPEEAPPAVEEASPVVEQAPPVVEEASPVVEQAPPVVEEASPVVEQAPPVVEEASPVVEQAPPVVEQAPPVVEQAPPVVEETPSVIEKKTVEQTAGEVAAEAASEGPQGPEEGSQAPAGASGLTHKDATGEVAPEISIAVTTLPVAASEISASPVQDQSPLAMLPQTTRSAGQMSCVRASITAGYAGDWLDISVPSSVSNIPFTTADASPTAIKAGAPAGSLGNGSTLENHPSAPGSGSGGGGGGSAAGGGSGSASSASSTLVDVLLQAAPLAMRRLRLAQPSWRTSFFVLIPERPD
jgi:outer membrane biosynthesis protein TonB